MSKTKTPKVCLSPEEASPLLGISSKDIRHKMRNGELDLGVAIDPKISGKKHWRFLIYLDKIYKITGGGPQRDQ